MELVKYICPDSPYVWNKNGVSECFDNVVLGFGANVATAVMVAGLGIVNKRHKDRRRIHLSTRVLVYILAAFGACVTTFDMVVLVKTSTQSTLYHEWLFRCSRFSVWVIILLVSRCGSWLDVLSNGMLCFWWIAKLALLIPQLQIVLSSPGVLKWTMEICGALTDTFFGILINIIRVKAAAYESR